MNEFGNLTTAFVEFACGFASLKDRRAYLGQHPELLTARAIDAATVYIRESRDKGWPQTTLISMRVMRNLLARAMEIGADAAFFEAEPSRDVTEAVSALLRVDPGVELMTTLFRYRIELSSPQAVGAFNQLRAKYEDDAEQLHKIEALWTSSGMFRKGAKPVSEVPPSAST